MKSSSILFSEYFKASEKEVSDEPSSYKNLDERALCTDPEDLKEIFKDPLVNGTWVDLGSGLGHTVISYSEFFPERKSIGVERELSRVEAARAISRELKFSCSFIHDDLLTADLPDGDTFFLYFPQGHVLDRILSELSKKKMFTLVAIESHGDFFPRLEKENHWLRLVKEIPLKSERHNPFARIYRPLEGKRDLAGLHRVSFLEKYFMIDEGHGPWWGDSFGLYASGEDYTLLHPPRTVKEKDIVKTLTRNELPEVLGFLISIRRLPGVEIVSHGKSFSGPIRKILGEEAFSVEFPGGEKLEWKDIQRIKQENQLCYDSSSDFFFLPHAH